MISKRLSETFSFVFVRDPALLDWRGGAASKAHAEYAMTYDISKIPEQILSQCTVVTSRPLSKKWEHLADSAHEIASARILFKHHITAMTHFPEFRIDPDTNAVADDVLDAIPIDAIREAAMVITRKAGLSTTPFMPPPTLSEDRIRYHALHAEIALTESASA